MSGIKRKWDRLTDEQRKEATGNLISYFETERDEKIGIIAANQILDFFLEHVGTKVYNKGIEDAKNALTKRMDELNYDLDDLLDW